MSQKQKIYGRVETVKITATAARAAGDLVHEGNWYGVCVDTIADTTQGMIHVRNVFQLTKNTTTDVLATGAVVEFVTGGKVQAHDQGAKIGKVYEASGNTDTTVLVELMPELY
jgi:predicted RecA/RadA family phage recombinase